MTYWILQASEGIRYAITKPVAFCDCYVGLLSLPGLRSAPETIRHGLRIAKGLSFQVRATTWVHPCMAWFYIEGHPNLKGASFAETGTSKQGVSILNAASAYINTLLLKDREVDQTIFLLFFGSLFGCFFGLRSGLSRGEPTVFEDGWLPRLPQCEHLVACAHCAAPAAGNQVLAE